MASESFSPGTPVSRGAGWQLWFSDMGGGVSVCRAGATDRAKSFSALGLQGRLAASGFADLRHADGLKQAMQAASPDVVLHLAAQPLVRYSYVAPVETYMVNVMGTVNLFEAVRMTPGIKAVVERHDRQVL